MEKKCSHCKETKDSSCFHKNAKTQDGLCNYCKQCKHSSDGKSYLRHAEKRRENKAQYHREHVEQDRSRTEQWRLDNPGYYSYQRRRQKALMRGLSWSIDRDWYLDNIWNQPCRYHDGPSEGGIDRVDNSIGYEPSNCVPCCSWCNSIKMEHSTDEMYERLRNMIGKIGV